MSKKIAILLLNHTEQEEYLEKHGYELMDFCNEFWGKQIAANPLDDIDLDQITSYFERTEDEPEGRIEKFNEDGYLTLKEKKEFEEYLREDAIENEYHPGIFVGYLDLDEARYVVVSERTGGAFDCSASLFGIFEDEKAAQKALNSNGLKLIEC